MPAAARLPDLRPIKRQQVEYIAKGKDPDSVEVALADASKSFQEMIGFLTKKTKEKGINLTAVKGESKPEPPLSIGYSLYNKIMDWR